MTETATQEQIEETARKGRERLLSLQDSRGYWAFAVEADATIPSEYILLQRFLGRAIDPDLADRLARYLRRRQRPDGGWPLYAGGPPDISVTVKAYFALKLCGDPPGAPHMARARELVLSMGGASRVNVFTRISLALFGQIPWRTAPAMPVEIMLLPRWFFFHLQKVSYWSRTVIAPLLILYAARPVCALEAGKGVEELFSLPQDRIREVGRFTPGRIRKDLFLLLDRGLKQADGWVPLTVRRKAVRLAERWTLERMQGEGGLGAIFPAMANAVMALKVLGYADDHPDMVRGLRALDDLLVTRGDESFCQPCVSPVWDTAISLTSLIEAGVPRENDAVRSAVGWLFGRQITVRGDWADRAPDLTPGGWAFQFENDMYPDVDDTAKVLIALFRAGVLGEEERREALSRAVRWVLGMQGSDGGWGAFDVDNNRLYLNEIPFADHGALLDPSTADVTGRAVEMLGMLGYRKSDRPVARALAFLRREQEECGAWFGRWGVNYLYGTWSVLAAFRQVGEDMSQAHIRRAVGWLKSRQNPDGGWGESCRSYEDPSLAGSGESTASQTAWALLGLMAAGEAESPEVARGILHLVRMQDDKGGWDEPQFTGTGFPRVFYLRYHGYRQYFPTWALGTYRRLIVSGATAQDEARLAPSADPFRFSGR